MNEMKKNQVEEGRAQAVTPDLNVPDQECVTAGELDPCAIIIVGASGDLTARKLFPALFNLYLNGGLPDSFVIVGCGRTELTDQEFGNKMNGFLSERDDFDESRWSAFTKQIFYRSIDDYGRLPSFEELNRFVRELDRKFGTKGNRLFYLAIPPSLYKTVTHMIGQSGMSRETGGWSRIVVEKPFGSDLQTAVDLDRTIHEYFDERQIFRIDHYLAKETVQNILMFRYANSIFEPIWNRRYVSHVHITASETVGLERRAGYYEKSGVLRDMFQNHMMQLLALTAMEPPPLFEAEQVRDEKTKVFRALRPFPVENLRDYIVLGQYGPGQVDNREVRGYREEEAVNENSLTPTFASMKVFIDNWRWQGVPFYLTSGKLLAKKLTEIVVYFKEIPHSVFRNSIREEIPPNQITLGVYPEEKITLTFQAKNPGATIRLRPVTMDFFYNQNYHGPILEAYEKVLIDCIRGDQMLFWREDAVELCWAFLTPILKECETCGYREEMLQFYKAGSWGPESFLQIP
ncbi:MAG: glucose-6-phosphate dehydrogenase [Desulfoferrobacter sp.]